MSNTMKAARWHAAKDIRVEETEIPTAGQKQVKIEVQFTGICGSDLHEYTHGPMLIPVDKPYSLNGHQGVTTLGHEFSGIVSEVGKGVTNVKVGDRVVVEPLFKNPESPFIANGEYNLSEPLGFVGLTSNGGFAKYTVVEDYMVHKIPDSMSFEQGVQATIAAGSPNVIVVDVADKRLEKATEVGATHVINGKTEDIPAQVKKLTNGGADVYLDAAGVQATYENGLKSLRNGGTAVLVALFGKPVTHDAFDQVVREITIKGIIAYRNIFPQVIALIDSGRMPVEKLVTQKIKLDNIVADGFEALVSNPSQVKILVDING